MNLQLLSVSNYKKTDFNIKHCPFLLRMAFLGIVFLLTASLASAQNKRPAKNSNADDVEIHGDAGGAGKCVIFPPTPYISVIQPACGDPNGVITINNYGPNFEYRYDIKDSSYSIATQNNFNVSPGKTYFVWTVDWRGCKSLGNSSVDIIPSSTNFITNIADIPYTYNTNKPAEPLSVVAEGINLTYQWFSATDKISIGAAIPGATTSSYTPPTNTAGTTYYYVVVTGDCGSIKSIIVQVNILTATIPKVLIQQNITGPQLGCRAINSTELSLMVTNLPAGPTPNYDWYWSTEENANTLEYNYETTAEIIEVVNINATRYYRVKVTSNDPNNPYSFWTKVSTIRIKSEPQIITDIGGSYTISNGIPQKLSLQDVTGDNITYQWFTNTINSNSGGTPVPNSDNSTARAGVTAPGTYYVYALVSGTCGSVASSVVKITVNNSPVAGTISGATSVCGSINSSVLSLSYYTGTVQWQSSTNNIDFSNISGATSPAYTATNLSVSTWYRVIVTAGTTATSESAEISINALPGITTDLKTGLYNTSKNGKPITLNVAASGNPLTYQWYSYPTGMAPVPVSTGGQASSLSPDISVEGLIYYYVIINNGCTTVQSKTAAVVVSPEIMPDASNIVYVTKNGSGDYSGRNWSNATYSIQNAINGNNVHSIWVANGSYYPDRGGANSVGDRNASFLLKNNLKIYGGFAGTETLLSQRDSTRATNNTILSGDIGTAGDNTDNAYHVVVSAGVVGSATLNGFTVQGGYANGGASDVINGISIAENSGGGISVSSSNPSISNVTIVGNYGADAGGLYNNLASPVFTNMIISSNTAASYGGAMYNNYSTPVFNNMIVSGNSAGVSGAGICNYASSPLITNTLISGNASTWAAGLYNVQSSNSVLTNVTISGNNATNNGAGIYNESGSSPLIRNSIIYGNKDGIVNADGTCVPSFIYSLVQGGLQSGTGNIDGDTHDPVFVSPLGFASSPVTGGDYRLLNSTSAAYNSGNNIYFNVGQNPDLSAITRDLDGNPRMTGIIDMGPYELLSALPVSLVSFTAQQAGIKSKLTWSTTREINNKSFIISRAADGSNFTEIGKVNAQGNSTNQSDYVFYDLGPLRGNNYYKLEQVDNDGRKTVAGIRLVNFTRSISINLYPNPVRNNLVVEFTEGLYGHIQLTDLSGRVLKVFMPAKTTTRQDVNMSNLASGTYFLVFTGNDKMETRKVVKE